MKGCTFLLLFLSLSLSYKAIIVPVSLWKSCWRRHIFWTLRKSKPLEAATWQHLVYHLINR